MVNSEVPEIVMIFRKHFAVGFRRYFIAQTRIKKKKKRTLKNELREVTERKKKMNIIRKTIQNKIVRGRISTRGSYSRLDQYFTY